jgi:hypothetical protein
MAEPTPTPKPEPPKEEAKGLLASLAAGGDNTVKIAIIALILITGGTNFFATRQSSDTSSAELTTAIKEIHDLHDQLQGSIDRQKEIISMLKNQPK